MCLKKCYLKHGMETGTRMAKCLDSNSIGVVFFRNEIECFYSFNRNETRFIRMEHVFL